MESQANDTLYLILSYFIGYQLMKYREVNKRWKKIIETRILYRDPLPSIEKCIISSDYYNFLEHSGEELNEYQEQLIMLNKNKHFMNLCSGTYVDIHKLIDHYTYIGDLETIEYIVSLLNYEYSNDIMEKAICYNKIHILKFSLNELDKKYSKNMDDSINRAFGIAIGNNNMDIINFLRDYINQKNIIVNGQSIYIFYTMYSSGYNYKYNTVIPFILNQFPLFGIHIREMMGRAAFYGDFYLLLFYLQYISKHNLTVSLSEILSVAYRLGNFFSVLLLLYYGARMEYKFWFLHLDSFIMENIGKLIVYHKLKLVCLFIINWWIHSVF
jgi:hypothetical protein